MTIKFFHKTVRGKRGKQVAFLREDGICVYSKSRKKARCADYLFPNFVTSFNNRV